MADQGTRARGRSRTRAAGQPETIRRPGEVVPAAGAGRGRVARGAREAQPPAAAAAQPVTVGSAQTSRPPQQSHAEVEKALSKLTLASGGEGEGARGGRRRGGRNEVEVRTRPSHIVDKTGKDGEMVRLTANYFPINSTPQWAIYQYHVDFSPEIDTQRGRRELLRVHASKLGQYLFDGMMLFTANRLPSEEHEMFSNRQSDNEKIMIKAKLIKEIPPTDPIVMQILSIQMRKNLRHLNFQLLGRQYYDPVASVSIREHNLELWPGFVTAIHQHESAPLLCADLTFKVLRKDTVLHQIQDIYRRNQRTFQDDVLKQIVGQIVLTRYNNRTYRIDDVKFNENPLATFQMKDGSSISFIDYYYKTYQIKIMDAKQPLLYSQPSKRDAQRGRVEPVILIPELCTMTGLSEETRNNFHIMKAIGDHTRGAPSSRLECITRFLNRINSNETIVREMGQWNLSFSSNLVDIPGRILPPETLHQAANVKYTVDPRTADWTKEMRGARLLTPFNLTKWVVITGPRDAENAQSFLNALTRVGGPMGMRIQRPDFIRLNSDRPPDYLHALASQPSDIEFVMFVFANNQKARYDAIKKHCCIINPIPSQVILGKTISKPNMHMSVATKVAIQMNCKLGGAPWYTPIPMKNAMVIGYDSYHDSSMRGRSVGAVCCSLDKDFTKYCSLAEFQTSHQELINGLFSSITAGLKRYNEVNKTLPDKIFIYRDGVGEGQLSLVSEFEVPQILECFRRIGSDYNPKVAFIVVTKRLNTRIFLKRNGHSVDNPLPGTVVDNTITRPEWYDFFLISQTVRQGTVSPTHYNVVYDTTGFSPNVMQRLTYKLTHLYYNWPGTLRVPAPNMYAHKLAFLTGQSLHDLPSRQLCDKLYFL